MKAELSRPPYQGASSAPLLPLAARVLASPGDGAALAAAAALLGGYLVRAAARSAADPARVLSALLGALSRPLRAIAEADAKQEIGDRIDSILANENRSWGRQVAHSTPDAAAVESAAAPEPGGLDIDDRRKLERVLSRLSPDRRAALEAAYGEELSEDELGARFNKPARAAAKQAERALAEARGIAEEEGD